MSLRGFHLPVLRILWENRPAPQPQIISANTGAREMDSILLKLHRVLKNLTGWA